MRNLGGLSKGDFTDAQIYETLNKENICKTKKTRQRIKTREPKQWTGCYEPKSLTMARINEYFDGNISCDYLTSPGQSIDIIL
jgi:hypothetical protein